MGNTAKQCTLGIFQDSDFAGDLEDSKSTSGVALCVVGSQTLFPISWMCEEQTSVSHSSTESDIISLDAGWGLDGIPALDLWDLIVAVLGNTNWNRIERRDLLMNKREVRSTPHTLQNGSDLEECSVFWTMLTLFPQTSNLHIRKLCCMCFQ